MHLRALRARQGREGRGAAARGPEQVQAGGRGGGRGAGQHVVRVGKGGG